MTVMSIDGSSPAKPCSRLRCIEGGFAVVPFVRMFHWEDDGVVHNIEPREGGEQGDPMMPLLFALGQDSALTTVQGSLGAENGLMAFLDDLYVATPIPDGLRNVHGTEQQELWMQKKLPHSHQRRHYPGVELLWSATRIL